MNKLILMLSLSLALFAGCKKETGPQGATGPQGTPGPAGTNGVSAISSYTFTTLSTDWAVGCSGTCWTAPYVNGKLDANFINTGAIQCYLWNGTGEWNALPITNGDVEYYFGYQAGEVDFKIRSASGATTVYNPGLQIFKIVMIPQ